MSRVKKAKEEPKAKLTAQQVLEGATNNPALAMEEFELDGKTYKVMHPEYNDYLEFLHLLQPVLKGMFTFGKAKIGPEMAAKLPGIGVLDLGPDKLSVGDILSECGRNLPELVSIVCRQTDPTVTKELISKMRVSPFQLAKIVILQIAKINLIDEFSDFFALVAPMMR